MAKKLTLNIFLTTAVLATVLGISIPQDSLAWFDDQEIAETNALSASTLEFSVSPSNTDPLEGIAPYDSADPGTEYDHVLDLAKLGTLDFNYSITLGNFDDNGSGLCDNLMVKDDLPGSVFVMLNSYSLPLASYLTNPSLNFTIRLISDDPDLMEQTCNFAYKVTGWQTDMPDANTGFSDQKLVGDSILSDPWEIEPAQTGGQSYEEEGSEEENIGNEEDTGNIGDTENDGNDEENNEDLGSQEQQIEQEEEEIKIEEPEEAIIPVEDKGENGSGGNEGNESGNNDTGNDTGGETAGGSETE